MAPRTAQFALLVMKLVTAPWTPPPMLAFDNRPFARQFTGGTDLCRRIVTRLRHAPILLLKHEIQGVNHAQQPERKDAQHNVDHGGLCFLRLEVNSERRDENRENN